MAVWKRTRPHQSHYHIDKYKHVYLPLWLGGQYTKAVNEGGSTSHAAEDILHSAGAGEPSFGEVGTTGICGLHIDAAGDDIRLVWPIPYDLDVHYPVEFRVHWSSGSTDDDDEITWKILYKEIDPDSDAVASPNTALDVAIPADANDDTANVYQITDWGRINAGKLHNGRILLLGVECDAADMSLATEPTYGYYLEIRYTRRVI